MKRMLLVALVVFSFAAVAQVPPPEVEYEPILLPMSFAGEVRGAFGTLWDAEVLMYNDGETGVRYRRQPCPLLVPDCGEGQVIGARTYVSLDLAGAGAIATPGSFIYVEKPADRRMRFTALLHDRARADENEGTEMPVVRARDFSTRIVLPRVPMPDVGRVALRIYGPGEAPFTARVKMFRLDRLDPLVDVFVEVPGVVTIVPNPFPYAPATWQSLDLLAEYPQLDAAASVRIEVEAVDENYPLWAFASITNSATQLVTTITPQ